MRKKGPIRFRRETIILLEFLPWLASLGTFSPITFLSFSLYICLLFMYPYPTSSMELDSKKFFFNLLLFSLKTIGLGSYISNEPSFWLFGWLYFNLLTQILNSIRWRMDSTFIFGRVYLKDELLTFPVPCFQILVLAFFQLRVLLKGSISSFWNFVTLLEWLTFLGILIMITLLLINFYLGNDPTLRSNKHKNDLVFEIQTAFTIFVGIYWVITELLLVLILLGIVSFVALHSLKENNRNTFEWLKNEDWIGRLYDHFQTDTTTVRKDRECVVCMENTVDTVLVPCGHLCVCMQCSNQLKPLNCPICKVAVQSVVRTFDVTFKDD